MKQERISATIPKPLKEQLHKAAQEEGMSDSEFIALALRSYLHPIRKPQRSED